jgi:hypothetical protein
MKRVSTTFQSSVEIRVSPNVRQKQSICEVSGTIILLLLLLQSLSDGDLVGYVIMPPGFVRSSLLIIAAKKTKRQIWTSVR